MSAVSSCSTSRVDLIADFSTGDWYDVGICDGRLCEGARFKVSHDHATEGEGAGKR